MRCHQCDTENADEAKYCINCGAKLVAPPHFCVKCGAEVSPGTRFCGQCGHETAQTLSEEPLASKVTATTPKKKGKTTTAVFAIAAAIIVIGGGIFYFTSSSEAPTEERAAVYEETTESAVYEETTDSTGIAKFNLDGETILVSVVDESSPSQALSRVKVNIAKQQGISLVYAKDEGGEFFPELTFLDSTSTQTKATTVAMTPVSDKSWTISQPITVGINPELLPEVCRISYSSLLAFIKGEYPDVETIVFLFDENTGDITHSTVSISEAPTPGVIYAYLQKEPKTASLGLFPKAHAVAPVLVFAVTASIVAATFDIPTSGMDLLIHLGKCYGEAQAGSPYAITMPDLSGCSEYNVAQELDKCGLRSTPIEVLDEDIIERGYVKNAGDFEAIKLVGFVVRQLPEPNTVFNSDPDQRYWRMPDKVVVWVGRLGEEYITEELEEEPEAVPEEVTEEEPKEEPEKKLQEEPAPSYREIILDDDFIVYYVTHEDAICSELLQEITDGIVSLRCEQASACWRAHYVKEINTEGASKLRIKADLSLIDHARFFVESHGVGVKYDDYVDLMVVSSDPRPTFDRECNKILSKSDWAQCGIVNTDPSVIGHSGVPKFTESQACDFEVDVAGMDKVYLVLRVADAWLADVEGTLSNLQIYYLTSE